jgi:cytochrome c oxidase subunit 4
MHDHQSSHHVIVPVKTYVAVFVALLFLTFVTVFITRFDFGALNLIVALLVALVKAGLVVMIFMGLKWNKSFDRFSFFGCLIFLFIFFLLVFVDIPLRGYRGHENAQPINIKSPVKPMVPGEKPAHH